MAINTDIADELFDKTEFTIGMEVAYQYYLNNGDGPGYVMFPIGRFILKGNALNNGPSLFDEIGQFSNEHPYFKAGLSGGSVEKAKPVIKGGKTFVHRVRLQNLRP